MSLKIPQSASSDPKRTSIITTLQLDKNAGLVDKNEDHSLFRRRVNQVKYDFTEYAHGTADKIRGIFQSSLTFLIRGSLSIHKDSLSKTFSHSSTI